MLKVPSAQGPPAPRSTRVVPQIMALEPHSSEHGASSRKIVPRCSITRHRLKQHCAGKPGFIRQHSPWLLWDPAQSGTCTAGWRGQLPAAARDGSSCCPHAHPPSCGVLSNNCHTGQGDRAEMEIRGDTTAGRCCKALFHLLCQGNNQRNKLTTRQVILWCFFPSQLHYLEKFIPAGLLSLILLLLLLQRQGTTQMFPRGDSRIHTQ